MGDAALLWTFLSSLLEKGRSSFPLSSFLAEASATRLEALHD
jgi:hypothetical protein